MCFCNIHIPMMLNNTPEHELMSELCLFTPIYSKFTPTVLYVAQSALEDLPAATSALPVGTSTPAVLSGARGHALAGLLPLRAALGPHGPPRAAGRVRPRDGPRARHERRGCAAALHAAGGGRRIARTSLVLTDAMAVPSACGTRAQQPGANLEPPQRSNPRPRPRPPRQRSAVAERRLFSGVYACGT
jgi:hypothetical protein